MDKTLLREFMLQLNKLEEEEYLLSTVAYGTAPTLKGIKPSSLVSFSTRGRNLYQLWEKYKMKVSFELGLSYFELKKTKKQQLVLFYNSEILQEYIAHQKNRSFLSSMGYEAAMTLEQSLELLKVRFECLCPHEIGVFLGIPVEDILGFIHHKGEKCLFCSYWKVYHEPERARKLFQHYDKAKTSVINSIMNLYPAPKVLEAVG